MDKPRWNDPYTAMTDLIAIHKKYWITATPEEFAEYLRMNPGYTEGMPSSVRDMIGHVRWGLSTVGKEKFQKDFKLPQDYFAALCEYVRLFPMDLPHPGELPTN